MSEYSHILDKEEYIIQNNRQEETHTETIQNAALQILSDAIPSTMGLLFIFIAETINIIFISGYNDADMIAGIGIGTLYINATGYIVGAGLIGGLDTLCSQAFGNRKLDMIGVYTNVTRVVIIGFFITMSIPFTLFSKSALLMIGQDEIVAVYASNFCHSMLFSLFFALQYNITLRYLQSMNIFRPGMFITLFTVSLHPLWCYLFIYKYDLNVVGAGLAMTITQLMNLIIVSLYTHYKISELYPETYFFINKDIFVYDLFSDYLKKAVPAAILFAADWLGFEVLTLMSSYISSLSLAANVCLFNFITMVFMIPLGISFACTTLVGNSIGSNNVKQAKTYTIAALLTGACIIGIITLLVFLFRKDIPYIYTSDPNIANLVSGLLGIWICFSIIDAMQNILHGVIKGLGKQQIASIIALIILYPINIPLAYLFGFVWELGLYGLWYSQMISVFLMGMSYICVILYYDWQLIADKTIENLNQKHTIYEMKKMSKLDINNDFIELSQI
jgi:MATE family multidrug resistance protein